MILGVRPSLTFHLGSTNWDLDTVRSSHIKEPELVPDSMPAGGDIANSAMRASSETTFADSIQRDHQGAMAAASLPAMKQSGRSLAEYLTFAESVRAGLPPRKREGLVVESFLEGLDDLAVRTMLERQMDDVGWAWNVMSTSLRSFMDHRQTSQTSGLGMERNPQKGPENDVKKTAKAPVYGGTARSRKKRPPIPIVPADDEDVLY